MEKNYWMYLFFLIFLLCAVLALFLVQSSRETSYKKKYEALREQNDRDKKKYDLLRKSYATLAGRHTALLERMMLEPATLRKYVPQYEEMTDDKELGQRVRRDIGRLEVERAQLDNLGELDAAGAAEPGGKKAAEESKTNGKATVP